MTLWKSERAARSRAFSALAKSLEQEAVRAHLAAEREELAAEHDARLRKVPEAMRKIRALMDKRGVCEVEAIAWAAEVYDLPAASVAVWWREAAHKSEAGERWRRDREIMRLAREGRTNQEIAERVGLCKGSVSRVIRGKIRDGALLGIVERVSPPKSLQPSEAKPSRMPAPRKRLPPPGAS